MAQQSVIHAWAHQVIAALSCFDSVCGLDAQHCVNVTTNLVCRSCSSFVVYLDAQQCMNVTNKRVLQIEDGSLGSPPAEQILNELQPAHWFSAHLHVKYAAVVPHNPPQHGQQGRGQKRKSPSRASSPPPGLGRGSDKGQQAGANFTKFLALDKCLPRRGFLQVRLCACAWLQLCAV